jgi:hypothetical protein
MRMSAWSERSRVRQTGGWARGGLAFAAVAGLIALVGCGSSKSASASKPAYCAARTSLENSIKGLTSLNPSSGISGLQASLKKIESDAAALASSAKSSFPSQTSAITSSVNSLKGAVAGLSSSPSAAQIGTVATDAKNVVDSVQTFMHATSSKCS